MVKSILLLILHKTDSHLRVIVCFNLFFSISLISGGQMVRKPLTASYAVVNAYSSFHHDAISFSGNQASLASVKSSSAGLLCERKFMLSELAQYNGGFVLPTNSGVFAFTGGHAGSQSYHESQLGLAYG